MRTLKCFSGNTGIGESPTIAKKTIVAKVLFKELRTNKRVLLEREYENYQRYIKGDRSVELYSATKQQADRFLARLRKTGGRVDPEKEYPLILRRDVYKAETKLTPYWIKIPVYGVKGGINIPIRAWNT